MIDHIGISVGSIARATEFYLKALAPLGYGIVMEVSAEETGHGAAIAFGAPGEAVDF
jgi:catechol 2,3-dioxygenase-like lactoylglutathione lyase family enzyme